MSVVISVLASYTALDLAGRVAAARGRPRLMWLSGGAFAMGTGIWSMHFLGMLAWSVPVSLSYDVGLVILSVLLAIIGSGFALWVISARETRIAHLALAAPFMGAAIAGMHYTGMAALRGSIHLKWHAGLVAASIAIAVVASYAALWLAFRFTGEHIERAGRKKFAASVLMGVAICGMHYTGMAAAHALPGERMLHGSVLPTGGLAAAVVSITLIILGMAAVVAMIDRQLTTTTSLAAENERLYRAAEAEIAERKRAEAALRSSEEQLRQSQRIEAVGRLAGGIAHDFNNLLTAISGHTELLLAQTPPSDARREDMLEIRHGADRAAALTRQLLAFSRKQVLLPQAMSLNACVMRTERMLRRLIGENITISTQLSNDLHAIWADPGQIEQVLLNLAVNARDAMSQGGTITIRTMNAETCVDEGVTIPEGRHVLLIVTDTGCGMDAETASHIFDPFFTTKEQGKGTGLGLSTVYGIVRQSDGAVWVKSAPGAGSTFYVCLPGIEREDVADVDPATTESPGGNETILLVEDEPAVRSLATKLLNRKGYNVIEALDVDDAVRIADESADQIDLLLTDIVMPVMNGPALARIITRIRPTIRVLFMSGYTEDSILQETHTATPSGFLAKPFTVDGLAAKVREVLDTPQ